jgi:hypothetical protein
MPSHPTGDYSLERWRSCLPLVAGETQELVDRIKIPGVRPCDDGPALPSDAPLGSHPTKELLLNIAHWPITGRALCPRGERWGQGLEPVERFACCHLLGWGKFLEEETSHGDDRNPLSKRNHLGMGEPKRVFGQKRFLGNDGADIVAPAAPLRMTKLT